MKTPHKIIALTLTLVLMISAMPSAYAADLPFTDVSSDSWYHQYVDYVLST